MALHPGKKGYCHKHGVYDEYCIDCTNDLEKSMLAKNETYGTADYEAAKAIVKDRTPGFNEGVTTAQTYDKNTEGSLKMLRWEIYDLIDNYSGDICKTVRGCLKQEVEKLFKQYTNS